jgi:hypothetical protein
MGRLIKSPQLLCPLLWFTPVETLGEISLWGVHIEIDSKLNTWGGYFSWPFFGRLTIYKR